MPNSPKVSFNLINNNIEVTKPLNGVSCMLARTTSGPAGLGSTVINSVTKFRSIYGSEIVPDGTPSNIEKALKNGSKLRIIRVTANDLYTSWLSYIASKSGSYADQNDGSPIAFKLCLSGSELGYSKSGVSDLLADGGSTKFNFMFTQKSNTQDFLEYAIIQGQLSVESDGILYLTTKGTTNTGDVKVLEKIAVMNIYINGDVLVFDTDVLRDFINTCKYWDIWCTGGSYQVIVSSEVTWESAIDCAALFGSMAATPMGAQHINWFAQNITGLPAVASGGGSAAQKLKMTLYQGATSTTVAGDGLWTSSTAIVPMATKGSYSLWTLYYVNGSSGSTPAKADWIAAANYVKDLTDVYVVIASHLHQHLSADADVTAVHKAIAEIADEYEEFQYYIEVPCTESDTKDSLITKVQSLMGAIGRSKYVSYYTGGIKYYDVSGLLVNSECIGTVVGLADNCASNYGPYRSFAGMNRGVIADGNGPVIQNYGAPSRYDDLNEMAQACLNVIVLKQTRTAGLATVLWHSFTSQKRQDSFRFNHAVRLALYIKKQVRPILESYIEEPNMWTSWKRIYLEAKPIMDGLVTDEAITEYTWDGDQDATSWDELTVNNEADARTGKYKLNIKVKDVATMQDIQVNLIYDQASNTVSASITNV